MLPSLHFSYRAYILVLTFVVYAAYHMSRKPFSVVAVSSKIYGVYNTYDEPYLSMLVLLQRPDIDEQSDNNRNHVCMNEPDTVFTTQLYFNSLHNHNKLQWSLRIMDTVGVNVLSVVRRLSLPRFYPKVP